MNTHIDTLASWWERAERGPINKGDTLIQSHHTAPDEYTVYVAEDSNIDSGTYVRILHRAEPPKPAWHDAVAVIAHKDGEYGLTGREVYVRGDYDKWASAYHYAHTSELIDPVPLIEAKVTDEMAEAVLTTHYEGPPVGGWSSGTVELMRSAMERGLGIAQS